MGIAQVLLRENQSRRDLTKVARYPAAAGLEIEAKKQARPVSVRDDRNARAFGLARGSAIASIRRSSRSSFVVLPMADRPGRIAL